MAKKGKPSEKKRIFSKSGTKQRHKDNVRSKIDKTQENRKYRLCGDKDETINYVISECCKLEQKDYRTRHIWVGKVIHWELCKFF